MPRSRSKEESIAAPAGDGRLRLVLAQVPAVIWTTDRDLRFTSSDGAALTRRVDGHVLGRPLSEVVPPGSPAIAAHRSALDGESVRYDDHVDGRSFQARVEPLRNDDGRVIGCLGVALDITERTSAERDLRESERRFRMLADNAPGVIYLCRNDARYTMLILNDEVERLTGYPAEEFLNDRVSFVDLYHPDDASGIAPEVEAALSGRRAYHLLYRLRHREGHWVWVEENGVGVFDGERLRYLEGFLLDVTARVAAEEDARQLRRDQLEHRVTERTAELHDLTGRLRQEIDERKRAERELRESERRLHSILNNSTAVVYMKDLDGRYLLVNKQYEKIFEFNRDDVIGRTDYDIFDEPIATKLRENDREVVARGEPIEFEEVVRHGNGELYTYISIKFPIRDAEGRIYAACGISTDITDRKRAERNARQHRDQLAHVTRLSTMGEMASGLAHELNQPLAAISNYAHGCLMRLKAGSMNPDVVADVIGRVARQADRAGQIIHRLRGFVKKESAQQDFFELSHVIHDAVVMVEHESREQEVPIQLDLDESVPAVFGDGIQVEQIILNLLKNAIEACAEDGRSAPVIVSTSIDPRGNHVLLRVIDRGSGADSEAMKRLFDPFFSTKPSGMGMGLNISQTIAEAHGGRLWAERNDDRGLTMCLSLPLRKRVRS